MKEIKECNGFKDLRIVDNFYQTSSFFPMPTTEIATLDEEGNTKVYASIFNPEEENPVLLR